MPPIQVYSASPINASKASGVTPQTQVSEGSNERQETSEAASTAAGPLTSSISGGQQAAGLAARPGAGPSLPLQTGMPQSNNYLPAYPTPTVDEGSSRFENPNPPAPQPGAVPVPPSRERQIPPPPKAGESAAAELQRRAQAATTAPPHLPPQMAYQPPTATQPIQGRSSTTTTPATHAGGPYPTSLQDTNPNAGYANPPGYQQGAGTSGFNHYQGQGNDYGGSQNSSHWSSAGGDEQPGVWDTARKWASAAGESLAAAESEVWKKINKG